MATTTHATARLRARNQLTLPDEVVQAVGVEEGARFLVEVADEDPDTIRLYRIRPSYAGALRDVYGNTGEYLEVERGSWD